MPATTPTKSLSPAELAKLEHAFATEPASEAYKPLAEAYLGMGRFMEAMVVCKKGVKAHPTTPDPRMLLARVYAEQGKDKKALEELAAALQVAPSDKQVLRTIGALQMKAGEPDAGRANLLKAFEVEPQDADTKALLELHKIPLPKGAEPPPPPPAPAPVAAAAPSRAEPTSRNEPASAPSGQRSSGARPAPKANGAESYGSMPARRGPPPRPTAGASSSGQLPAMRRAAYDDDYEEVSGLRSQPRPSGFIHTKKKNKFAFLLLAVLLPTSLVGYWAVGRWKALQNRELKRHLTAASEQLKHDSYDSYQKASKEAEEALNKSPDSGAAHAYLAYASAIRWGEHGGGDSARQQAQEHLKEAKEAKEESAYLYAAEALVATYSGKGSQAMSELDKQVREFNAKGARSPLMYLTLGIIQMNAGDLEHARENLEAAQGLSPADARVYAALGRLYRWRGEALQASKNFEFALRYERDHHESLLGGALLMLDQDSPNFGVPAKMLKKLIAAEPPPSPRQLAAAQLAQALLIARVSKVMSTLGGEGQKQLAEETGVSSDEGKAKADLAKAESVGIDMARIEPDLYLIKARRLRVDGQQDQALALINDAIKADPNRAYFYIELARVLMERPGGEKEARDALLKAIKTMGESPKLLVMLGDAYRRGGETDNAIAQYQRAVADPKAKNPEARFALGNLYRDKKEFGKAQEQLEKAAVEQIGQSTKLAATQTELGRVLEEKGDRVKAEEWFKKAVLNDSEYANGYYFYGKFLKMDGKTAAAAREAFKMYLKLEPHGQYAEDARNN